MTKTLLANTVTLEREANSTSSPREDYKEDFMMPCDNARAPGDSAPWGLAARPALSSASGVSLRKGLGGGLPLMLRGSLEGWEGG